MGHEAAGEVVAVAEFERVRVGDRVVAMPLAGCGECELCRSGDYIHCAQAFALSGYVNPVAGCDTMAHYLLKPDWLLLPIPDDISYEHASLACCALGPSFGAFEAMGVGEKRHRFDYRRSARSDWERSSTPAIAARACWRWRRFPGASTKAKALGAEAVFDPRDENALTQIREATGGRGVDCALDCSGNVQAERFCVDATRARGQVAFVGECYDSLELKISPDMIRKGLTLRGAWHYNLNDFPKVMDVIRHSPLIERLISHRAAHEPDRAGV